MHHAPRYSYKHTADRSVRPHLHLSLTYQKRLKKGFVMQKTETKNWSWQTHLCDNDGMYDMKVKTDKIHTGHEYELTGHLNQDTTF